MGRRRSIRLRGYDYTQAGGYFITLVAHRWQCLFGAIQNGVVALNVYGRMVETEWRSTGELRANVVLDEYVVMPNHFHGILLVTDDCRGTARRAPTVERFSRRTEGSVPTVVRSFKSAVTKAINGVRGTPGAPVWQRNYYEHVIRSEESLNEIRAYVASNPARWAFDRENIVQARPGILATKRAPKERAPF